MANTLRFHLSSGRVIDVPLDSTWPGNYEITPATAIYQEYKTEDGRFVYVRHSQIEVVEMYTTDSSAPVSDDDAGGVKRKLGF